MSMMNLSRISTEGKPTLDDLCYASALVEEIATIATIIGGAEADEAELRTAMNGIAGMLEITSNILAEGLDEIGNQKSAKGAA